MPEYLLLLHNDAELDASFSPEEMQAVIEEYMAWSAGLGARLKGNNKLTDEPGRHMVQSEGDVVVRDGPFSETKEVLGGYFLIEAADYDEAVEVSRSCPHLKYGGRIEVRQVEVLE